LIVGEDVCTAEADRFDAFATGLDGPEGVVWDAEREVLYAGGLHGQLYRVTLAGVVEHLTDFGPGAFVLGLALDAHGRVYVCERGTGRFLRYDPETATIEEYTTGTPGRPLITPNFPAFAPDGTLYLSDSGRWGDDDGVVYRVAPDRTTSVWSEKPSDFTNGLALAPDGSALYVAESRGSSVWRIPIQSDGSAGTAERLWHVPKTVPDGLAFDTDGMLYLSLYRPDSIQRIDPATGEPQLVIHDWTAQFLQAPTNIAFAGPELSVLVAANLAGEHLARWGGQLPAPGLPLPRPDIR
jgi:gluconolactonase